MNASARHLLLCATLSGFITVALGAFGAHALAGLMSERMREAWQTAVQYQGVHSLALLAVGLLAFRFPDDRWITRSGWLMLAGILLFSGSLYLLALTGLRPLALVTPFGGFCLLAGWATLAYAIHRLPAERTP